MLFSLIKSKRDKKYIVNIVNSFVFRGGAVFISFLSVRFAVDNLLPQEYGVWLTIYSVASWLFLLDGGLGNGLKNKLTQAIGDNDLLKGKKLVSTAYYSIAALMITLSIAIIISFFFIDYGKVFNVDKNLTLDVTYCFAIVAISLGLKFIFDLINSVFLAYQNASKIHLVNFLSNLLTFVFLVLILKYFKSHKLIVFGAIMSILPLFLYVAVNFYFFNKKFQTIKPSIKFFEKKYLKDLLSLGLKFFAIQISILIIFSTDNFIITQLFGPEAVTPYNVSYKLYSIFLVIWTILLTPYWTAFTDAYHKEDFDWIKKTVSNLEKLWLLLVLGVIIITLFVDKIYKLWLGDDIEIDLKITLSMAIFVLITTYSNIYVYVINGVGKIKLQLITSIIIGILNIPLSILFAKYFGLGVSGVMYATCFSLGITPILNYIQYRKIIQKKDTGVWSQ